MSIPPPPLQPIPTIPVKFQGTYRKKLVESIKKGDYKAFEKEIDFSILSNEQKSNLLNYFYPELDNHTPLYNAVVNNHLELCEALFKNGVDPQLDSAYIIAYKKGGKVFTIVQPLLKGKLLNVGECSLCEETSSLFPLDCGHIFCYECTFKWASECINEKKHISCLNQTCTEHIHINSIQLLVPSNSFQDYLTFLLKHTLSIISDFVWCPWCYSGHIAFGYDKQKCNLQCPDCTRKWCPMCSTAPHPSHTCEENKKLLMIEENQKNESWKSKYSKQCPKCFVSIEKNAGCSHMVCLHCQYQFCWICLGCYQEGRRVFDDNAACPCVK